MRHLVRPLAASFSAVLALSVWAQTAAPPLALTPTNAPPFPGVASTAPVKAPATPPVAATTPPAEDPLCWDATEKHLDVKPGEAIANFAFFVTNVASEDVMITRLSTSCHCTVADLPSEPFRLMPGAYVRIDVTMDLIDKPGGAYTNTVAAETSAGTRFLDVTANLPLTPQDSALARRLLNQRIARADARAMFRSDCAKCHLEPAFGKTGEALFTAACGVCHLAEHRATMVPDLAALNLKVPINGDYWRLWITYGKTGTFMPPWAQAQGGPLSTKQIDSLVEFLTKR